MAKINNFHRAVLGFSAFTLSACGGQKNVTNAEVNEALNPTNTPPELQRFGQNIGFLDPKASDENTGPVYVVPDLNREFGNPDDLCAQWREGAQGTAYVELPLNQQSRSLEEGIVARRNVTCTDWQLDPDGTFTARLADGNIIRLPAGEFTVGYDENGNLKFEFFPPKE